MITPLVSNALVVTAFPAAKPSLNQSENSQGVRPVSNAANASEMKRLPLPRQPGILQIQKNIHTYFFRHEIRDEGLNLRERIPHSIAALNPSPANLMLTDENFKIFEAKISVLEAYKKTQPSLAEQPIDRIKTLRWEALMDMTLNPSKTQLTRPIYPPDRYIKNAFSSTNQLHESLIRTANNRILARNLFRDTCDQMNDCIEHACEVEPSAYALWKTVIHTPDYRAILDENDYTYAILSHINFTLRQNIPGKLKTYAEDLESLAKIIIECEGFDKPQLEQTLDTFIAQARNHEAKAHDAHFIKARKQNLDAILKMLNKFKLINDNHNSRTCVIS